ncbi:efflux RND transporter periplasmic adaptor subunit [Mucilaginibacter sp. P25]
MVDTIHAEVREMQFKIEGNGKIYPERFAKVYSPASGVISSSRAGNSAVFGIGEEILKFDTKDLLLKLNRAKETAFNSTVNYKSDLLSQESLLKNKAPATLDTVYHKIRSNVGLVQAELDIQERQNELDRAVVRAPFGGKVANLKVHQGDFVRAGDELFTIYSATDLSMETDLLEEDINKIRQGQYCTVIPLATNKIHKAVVEEINPIVADNGMVKVRLHINEPGALLPGMNAQATINVPANRAIMLPKRAVVSRGGKMIVFTFENGRAVWNYVNIGHDDGKEVEILFGITSGQSVIISNNQQLNSDSPVAINKTSK